MSILIVDDTLSQQLLLSAVLLDAGHLGELARLVLDCVDAVFEIPEPASLALVLLAQAVVLGLYAHVRGLLCQAVDAVGGGAKEHGGGERGKFDPALVYGEASDVGTRAVGLRNDESVKTLVSVHRSVLLGRPFRAANMGRTRADGRERHCLPKEGDECGLLVYRVLSCETLPEGAAARPDIRATAMTGD